MSVAPRAALLVALALALVSAPSHAATRRTQVFSLHDLENGDQGSRITSVAKSVRGVSKARFDLLAVEATVTMRETVADSAVIGALYRAGFDATAGAGQGSYRAFAAWPDSADVAVLTDSGASVGPLEDLRVPGKYTAFDVFARWCGPCRQVDAELRTLADGRRDVAVRKLNVVSFTSPLARELGSKLKALPHVVVFSPDGKRTDISGLKPEKLRAALAAVR